MLGPSVPMVQSMRCWFAASFLFLLLAQTVAAQQREAAIEALPTASQSLVVAQDGLSQFRTERVGRGKLDIDLGILRAAYRLAPNMPVQATPEATATLWLAQQGAQFGITSTEQLELTKNVEAHGVRHLTFQQTFVGVPVYRRFVQVNLGVNGLPSMVQSGYAPHLEQAVAINPVPTISAIQARNRARETVSAQGALTNEAVLRIYPEATPRLVWLVTAWPNGAPGEWEVLLDARSGDIIHLIDRRIQARAHMVHPDSTAKSRTNRSKAKATGKGLVWIPDPLTSAGVSYGGAYQDFGDADRDELNSERVAVDLLDISQGSDARYRLEGPYVRIDGTVGSTQWTPPAEDSLDGFQYTRNDDRFEAVMVYYHMDTNQRYVRSLDLGRDIQNQAVRANPHGAGSADNSWYNPVQNSLSFGDGGIDDAEDAEVIIHEYGHALLEGSTANSIADNSEGGALHEGWSDYWAVSYTRGLMDAGTVPQGDWRKVFSWDGNATWPGRYLQTTQRYPEDTECDNVSWCDIYADGVVWATTLMSIWEELGKQVTDRLNLFSHAYLSYPVSMTDAAEALLQADQDLYQGAYAHVLEKWLGERGYIDVPAHGPALTHEPTIFHEDAGQPYSVVANITPQGGPITDAAVYYRYETGAWQRLALSDQGGNQWTTDIPVNSSISRLEYYITAAVVNYRVYVPEGAPTNFFTVNVGPDTEPPEASHRPITHATVADWPLTLMLAATDNYGIRQAGIHYRHLDAAGGEKASGGVVLSDQGNEQYTGVLSASDVQVGDYILYRVYVEDVALAGNQTHIPVLQEEPLRIDIIEPGILAAWDAETSTLTVTGDWMRGDSAYGALRTPTGSLAWATRLRGPYSAQPGLSTLTLPPVNILHYAEAHLEFWHWYDLEHADVPGPGTSAGRLYDGANIKVSFDRGASWTVLTPEVDYNGVIDGNRNNPMAGEPAYGGYSYGWRRVLVTLPDAPEDVLRFEMITRFDLGTDGANTESSHHGFAGWVIDDVRILAERPLDHVDPQITRPPPRNTNIPFGSPIPEIAVEATDNTGIEGVFADYKFTPASGPIIRGSFRLAQEPGSLTSFRSSVPGWETTALGDHLSYLVRVRDFDGNVAEAPQDNIGPFEIRALLAENQTALTSATTTGLWRAWETGFETASADGVQVSSLILKPFRVPVNADFTTLSLEHRFNLSEQAGGNLKLSRDNGESWEVVEPEGGYSHTFEGSRFHPMHGEQVLSGKADSLHVTWFDVLEHGGGLLWLRLDLATLGALQAGDYWQIKSALLTSSTAETTLDIQHSTTLWPNFPNPFQEQTTISYSVGKTGPVLLEIYNTLGQRVRTLVNQSQEPGTYMHQLSASGLAGGVYLLRLTTEDAQFVETLVLAR